MNSSLTGFSACSILLIVFHLSLAFLLRNAKVLTNCQSLRGKRAGDFVPKQEENGNAGALRFLNIGVGLQRLAKILRQSFKLQLYLRLLERYMRGRPVYQYPCHYRDLT